MVKYSQKKDKNRETATQHMIEILEEAGKISIKNPSQAKRYVIMAKKISSRLKVPIPINLKRRFCKNCNSYFNASNARIRLNKGKKTYSCLVCHDLKRVPYKG